MMSSGKMPPKMQKNESIEKIKKREEIESFVKEFNELQIISKSLMSCLENYPNINLKPAFVHLSKTKCNQILNDVVLSIYS